MAGVGLLQDLLIVVALALGIVYILGKFKIPHMVGFLFAGILLGPGGANIMEDPKQIELLAEIGIVLLLFTIGLRFPLKELTQLRLNVLIAGTLQVIVTIGTVALVGRLWIDDWRVTLFFGGLLAMSSTAIVLKLLEDRGEADAPHGRLMISVLIFQDLAVIPLMLFTPLLTQSGLQSNSLIGLTLFKAMGVLVVILLIGRFLFPWLMEKVAHTRSREVFTLTTLLAAMGTALVAGKFGVSLALGAFLAGMVIAESDYAHQMLTEVAPLRNALSSLFFISVGLLVDLNQWWLHPFSTFGSFAVVLLFKGVLLWGIARLCGFSNRVAVLSGIGLAQIGEFSFILAQTGFNQGLLNNNQHQLFLSVSVLSMAATPLLMRFAPKLAMLRLQEPGLPQAPSGQDHVIIVGYGLNGRSVARVLRRLDVPYKVIELNAHSVRRLKDQGEEALYGDAARLEVLQQAGLTMAKVLVLAIADPMTSRAIVVTARRANPNVIIMVRTRYLVEVDPLYKLGANEVVPEEFETAIELATLVMASYGTPEWIIEKEMSSIRSERYGLLRLDDPRRIPRRSFSALLAHADIDTMTLTANASVVGKSLVELNLRNRTGASIIAVARGHETFSNPGADYCLAAGDTLFLFGRAADIAAARSLLEALSA